MGCMSFWSTKNIDHGSYAGVRLHLPGTTGRANVKPQTFKTAAAAALPPGRSGVLLQLQESGITLPQSNMEPEKGSFTDYCPLQWAPSQVRCWLGGVQQRGLYWFCTAL